MRKLTLSLVILVTVLLLALPAVALADAGGPPDVAVQAADGEDGDEIDVPTNPDALIDYLAAIPIGVAVSAILEWTIIKNWPWFRNLSPLVRFLVILALYLLYPCLVTFGGYVNDSISGVTVDSGVVRASYYDALFRGGMAWVAAIVTHKQTKAPKPAG